MKKSVIASGVIIALGTVWIGATWYTGKVAEEQYQTQINLSNQKLAKWFKNSKDSVKVELTKFERGLFSSDVATSVVIKSAQENKTLTIPFTAKFLSRSIAVKPSCKIQCYTGNVFLLM